jgi:hypothetical protein
MSTLPGQVVHTWLGNFPEPVVGLVDLNAVANASAAALTGMRWAESGGVLIYNRTKVGQVRRETPATDHPPWRPRAQKTANPELSG